MALNWTLHIHVVELDKDGNMQSAWEGGHAVLYHGVFLSKWLSYLGISDLNEINKIMEESVKMKQFNHPNVMNLIGVCINAGPAPYIVMPFMTNGSLLSYLKKERPNLILDETADEDVVRAILHRH